MKKYLAVLIASLLIILAGCGPENGTAEQTTKAASLNAISADEIDVAELLARDAFAKGAYMLGAEDREIMLK